MAGSKIYLNVPYAQKDAAKALGARWDAANKKWYVTGDKDITLFAQWQQGSSSPPVPTAGNLKAQAAPKTNASGKKPVLGVVTLAADKHFVAYSGDEPPWD